MKIGILTLPLHTNYGGILQAYALQTVLERMGHEVCLIEKIKEFPRLPFWQSPILSTKEAIKRFLINYIPSLYEKNLYHKWMPYRFVDKYINRIIIKKYSEINDKDFNGIVVGSDQIWRPKYFPQIENAFLKFAENWDIKRISYAASFGTDKCEFTQNQIQECGRLLKKFNAVSVRELSGKELCHNIFNIDAELMIDPTLLLEPEDYTKLFLTNSNVQKSKGDLLVYILDESQEKAEVAKKIAMDKNLTPFYRGIKPSDKLTSPTVEQWLRGFYDAKFIVTDSFHGCVFSIIFRKPFIAYGNSERGLTRFLSLLEIFGLKHRLITNPSELNNIKDIDWALVHSVLSEYKQKAFTYLRCNLSEPIC